MMGRTHVLSGIALALALEPALNHTLTALHQPALHGAGDITQMIVGAGGGAMLNDYDHHNATMAHSLRPASSLLARIIGHLSGGHRNGTHSILAIIIFTLISRAIGETGWLGTTIWFGFLLASATWALDLVAEHHQTVHSIIIIAASISIGWWWNSTHTLINPWAITVGVTVGVTAHILGDMLTPERCPLLWPLSHRRFGIDLVTTNTWIERVGIATLLAATDAWLTHRLITHQPHPHPNHVHHQDLIATITGWLQHLFH